MELVRGFNNIKNKHTNVVLAIGNFDGLHLGHQEIIKTINKLKLPNSKSMVMNFYPHPMIFFQKTKNFSPITNFRAQYKALAKLTIDYWLRVKFNKKISSLTPEEFVKEYLYKKLAVKAVIVGDDFKFGKNREGDFSTLQTLGNKYGFITVKLNEYKVDNTRISSSYLRELLAKGYVAKLKDLMTNPYELRARVIRGDGRGRNWGFPTANLEIKNCGLPYGIYVVRAHCSKYGTKNAVASFGVRPTVAKGLKPLLEVHLLDGEYELYGEFLTVTFLKYLREEKNFNSFDELITAIKKDCENAKEYFMHSSGENKK